MSSKIKSVGGKDRNLNGWRPELPDHRDRPLRVTKTYAALEAMQEPVDLSPLCTRTEDQADLGSCTANAGTSALEFLYRKQGIVCPELSRMFLYYATRVWVAGWDPDEDSGAYIRDVMIALKRHGVSSEALWPYVLDEFNLTPLVKAKDDAMTRQILEYLSCPDLHSIKQSIFDGYPVEGGFSVPESMFYPQTELSGVVIVPFPNEQIVGGHAVLFVGYDDRLRLLKFQNSWGESWGDGGFGYLPYDYVEMGLADDFWTIRMAEDPTPRPTPDPVTPAPRRRSWWQRLLDWLRGIGASSAPQLNP